jgi:hypothetical protein
VVSRSRLSDVLSGRDDVQQIAKKLKVCRKSSMRQCAGLSVVLTAAPRFFRLRQKHGKAVIDEKAQSLLAPAPGSLPLCDSRFQTVASLFRSDWQCQGDFQSSSAPVARINKELAGALVCVCYVLRTVTPPAGDVKRNRK